MNRIRKTLAVAALLTMSLLTAAQAQMAIRPRVGVKGGLNASSLFYSQTGMSNKSERYGFHVGVFAQAPISDWLAIQPELLYTTKGASADYNVLGFNGRNTFRLNYAEVPVLLTFKLGDAVDLQAGPYVSYLLNSDINSNGTFSSGTTPLNRDQFNKVDYGLAGGLNIYFGKMVVGARYEQGFRPIANTALSEALLGKAKNSVGLISVGCSFN